MAALESEIDYESLPVNSSMTTHMIAGAIAGTMEHCVMYPFDFVKTRMQILRPDPNAQYRNIIHAFYKIVSTEGPLRTVRGINATLYGAGPAHALYFAAYEHLKTVLNKNMKQSSLTPGIAGIGATFLHDAVMTPAEVVKQRMQVYRSPYKSCLDCARCINKAEGITAFYRSFVTQLVMNIPFQSIHFVFYEASQDHINPQRTYNPTTHIVSGAFAGAIAAGATTPFDVCKTLLNTQQGCPLGLLNERVNVRGIVNAVVTVYSMGGVPGFFRGISARVLYQMPSTGLAWSVYEFFKHVLKNKNAIG